MDGEKRRDGIEPEGRMQQHVENTLIRPPSNLYFLYFLPFNSRVIILIGRPGRGRAGSCLSFRVRAESGHCLWRHADHRDGFGIDEIGFRQG